MLIPAVGWLAKLANRMLGEVREVQARLDRLETWKIEHEKAMALIQASADRICSANGAELHQSIRELRDELRDRRK